MMEDIDWNSITISELKESLIRTKIDVLTIVDEDGEHAFVIAKGKYAQRVIKEMLELSEWLE